MDYFYTLVLLGFFVFGAIIGSFLNVVLIRMRTGRGIGGRSMCMNCGKTLHAHELVPIFSYLAQGGRCRGCKSKISKQYILVELATALAFLLIAWKLLGTSLSVGSFFFAPFTFLLLPFSCITTVMLILIAAYDLRHMVIPDGFVISLFILSLLRLAYLAYTGEFLLSQIVSALVIGGAFLLIWVLSQGRYIGMGDVKLAFPLFLLLSFPDNVVALVLSFWSGAIIGVGLLAVSKIRARGRKYHMKSELPFAPFLILGTAIVYFVHIPLF